MSDEGFNHHHRFGLRITLPVEVESFEQATAIAKTVAKRTKFTVEILESWVGLPLVSTGTVEPDD